MSEHNQQTKQEQQELQKQKEKHEQYEQQQQEQQKKQNEYHQECKNYILDLQKYRNIFNINKDVLNNAYNAYNANNVKKAFDDVHNLQEKINMFLVEENNILKFLHNLIINEYLQEQDAYFLLQLKQEKRKSLLHFMSDSVSKMIPEYLTLLDISLKKELKITQNDYDFYAKEQNKRKSYMCNLFKKINSIEIYYPLHTFLIEKNHIDMLKEQERFNLFINKTIISS